MPKITILCENTVGRPGLIGEHGFAAWIELKEENLLLDTGSGQGVVHNALALRKDLTGVEKILISHGHYDHTAGLAPVLGLARKAVVYAHPGIFNHRVAIIGSGESRIVRSVGLPYDRGYLEGQGAGFVLAEGAQEVAPGVFLTGEVPRLTDFELNDPILFEERDGKYVPDPFLDDQSLVIPTALGLIIVFGCAHAGMINTIRKAQEITGQEQVHALLGGTHLGFHTPERLEASIRALKEIDPQMVAVSHCTGLRPAARLMQEFGDRFVFASAGGRFDFD